MEHHYVNAILTHQNPSDSDTQAVPDQKSMADSTFEQCILKLNFSFTSPGQNPGPNPFPVMRMTQKFATCLRFISQRSGISDGLAVGAFLANVSAVFLPSVTVLTHYGKNVGINVYTQTNAPPSSRKSDMFNPVQELLIQHDGERRKRIVEINQNIKIGKDVWKVRTNALKKQLTAASKKDKPEEYSRLENEFSQHLRKEPISLPDYCILQGDATPAAIIQALNDNQGCSTLLIDEGVLLYQKILNSEIHQINSAWSGAALNKTTIRGGNLYIENPRLTIHAFLQNDIFTKFGQGKTFTLLKDSGFFSRALICAPKVGPENNQNPNFTASEDELERLIAYLKKQLAINYPLDGVFSGEVRTLKLAADAENLVRQYYLALLAETKEGGMYAEIPGFCGKASEHVHRIAGIMHCIEQNETTEIDYATISAAIFLFDWYCTEHWRLIAKEGRPLNVEVAAEKLIKWMRHRKDRFQVEWISRPDIPRHVECFRDDPDLLDDVIRYLQQAGSIDTQSGRRKGQRGGRRWHDIRLSYQFEREERYMPA